MKTLEEETDLDAARDTVRRVFGDLEAADRVAVAFGDSGLPLLEAWVGVEFATLAGFTHLKLAPKAQEGFDVTLRRGTGTTSFDVTEAMDHLRNRHTEFSTEWVFFHESDAEMTYQERLFARVVGNRLHRKQSPDKDLILYVNTGWMPEADEVETHLKRWHGYFKDKFRSAYLLLGIDGQDGLVQIAPEYREIAPWRGEERPAEPPETMDELLAFLRE